MKRRRAVLLSIAFILALCAACGVWLHRERQQYALNRQLIAVLEHDDAKTALALVNAGADPNTRQEPPPAPSLQLLLNHFLHHTPSPVNDSPTAFVFACGTDGNSQSDPVAENLPLLQAMLSHGADVQAKTREKFTALHFAAFSDRLSTAELLLQHHADINAQLNDGRTPLMLAESNETQNMALLLIKHGANPNIQEITGFTALHFAIWQDNTGLLTRELLSYGAIPNLQDQGGNTPLMYAQQLNRLDLVRLLKRRAK